MTVLNKAENEKQKNVKFILSYLSQDDFRFDPQSAFSIELENKLLFALAMDEKIELRTFGNRTQAKLYSKSDFLIYHMISARERANNLWNM